MDSKLQIEVLTFEKQNLVFDFDKEIYDLNRQINLLSSNADTLDCLVAAASGLICGMLDVLWVGDFNLSRGREFANNQAEELVKKTAQKLGCENDDLKGCVKFLEDKFPIPADGNTPDC